MDVLGAGFSLIKFLVVGFVCLVGGLFLLAILFGKRKAHPLGLRSGVPERVWA